MCQPDGDKIASIRRWLSEGIELDDDLIPVELETPEARWIVSQFWELHATRSGGNGPGSITFSELKAYIELSGVHLSPWVIAQIRNIDSQFIAAYNQSVRENQLE